MISKKTELILLFSLTGLLFISLMIKIIYII